MTDQTRRADEDEEPVNNCIGNLEHHVHKVFATVRVPGEDFVYSPSAELFNRLDAYCDDSAMAESRPPLLIKGESGTGKSALLSNWLQRRERMTARSRNVAEEFIFWHAVGCSRQSMNVSFLLRRLIVELKARFELGRALPKTQDRFSWELPRFLDLASKRGKVIIVIDGLNRLVNSENVEDSLTWLPLEFPPNVRVILSVTTPPSADNEQRQITVQNTSTVLAVASTADGQGSNISLETASDMEHRSRAGESSYGSPGNAKLNDDTVSSIAESGNGVRRGDSMDDEEEAKDVVYFSDEEKPYYYSGSERLKVDDLDGNLKNNDTSGVTQKRKKSRILQELERRQIPFFIMKPLDKQQCRSLVEAFIHKSVNSESASLTTGPYINSYLTGRIGEAGPAGEVFGITKESEGSKEGPRSSTVLLGVEAAPAARVSSGRKDGSAIPGFLLFENQINALLNHSQGGTPLFLRLFLRCLHFAVSRGYSLWHVYEDWMQANSVPELLIRILDTLEGNFQRTRESTQVATDKTIAAGGLPTLKQLYSWHPAFQAQILDVANRDHSNHILRSPSKDALAAHSAGVAGTNRRPHAVAAADNQHPAADNEQGAGRDNAQRPLGEAQVIPMRHRRPPAMPTKESTDRQGLASLATAASGTGSRGGTGEKLSNEVQANLGDQAWNAVVKDAESKLSGALAETRKIINEALDTAKLLSDEQEITHLDALVLNIQSAHQDADMQAKERGFVRQVDQYGYSIRILRPKHTHQAHGDDSLSGHRNDHRDSFADGGSTKTEEFSDSDDDDSLVSLEDRSVMSDHTTHSKTIRLTQEIIPPAMRSEAYSGMSSLNNSRPVSPLMMSDAHKPPSSPVFSRAATAANAAALAAANTTVDASDDMHKLPVYLRGGVNTTGFGDLLGNALALLYVSRQGLRESELWKILSLLHYKSEREGRSSRDVRAQNHSIIRRVALNLLESRGQLVEKFKADDINKTGYVTHKQMLISIRKFYPDTKNSDFLRMLEYVENNTPASAVTPNSSNLLHFYQDRDLLIGHRVHYNKLFMLLNKLKKQNKFNQGKNNHGRSTAVKTKASTRGNSSQQNLDDEDDDDYDNFQLKADQSGPIRRSSSGAIAVSKKLKSFKGASTARTFTDGNADAFPGITINEDNFGTGEYSSGILGGEKDDDDGQFRLGPVVEESLIAILSALGVLHDAANKVLILPSDSEPFRQVIYNNYILKRNGGSLMSWHKLLVQHFQTEGNSLRKCEELPWHLKICRKWHTLRDTLVDLKTFDLMARTDLKDELMDYWVLLTEGPLLVNTTAAQQGDGTLMPHTAEAVPSPDGRGGGSVKLDDDTVLDNESTYTNLLREIDVAIENGISVKDARKKLFKHQIHPFDIVEELNKSLEAFVVAEHPSPRFLHRCIMQIARFLFDFSNFSHPSADFLRIGIDMEVLETFGGALSEDLMNFIIANAPPERRTDSFGGIIDGNADPDEGFGEMTGAVTSPGGRAPLTNATAATFSPGSISQKSSAVTKYFDNKNQSHEKEKFPTKQMLNKNLYCYLRWIWIQFPWLALHSASTAASKLRELRKEQELSRREKAVMDPALLKSHHGAGGNDDMNLDVLSAADDITSSKDNQALLRLWNVKKSDPTIPVFHHSVNKRLAAIKPRMSASATLERSAEVTYNNLYNELTAPSHIYKLRMGHRQHDKYRKKFEDEVEYTKTIPHAQHSIRSLKRGSLFPTYEAFIKEARQKKLDELENEANLMAVSGRRKPKPMPVFDVEEALAQQHLRRGGKMDTNPFLVQQLDDEIRHLTNDEYIDRNRVERIGAAVITDEVGLEYEATLERISRMKSIGNKLHQIEREKKKKITALEREVRIRNDSDSQMIDQVQNSEMLIQNLHERNQTMEKNLENAKLLEEGLSELLTMLKNNPPYLEAHVQALEIEVELAEKQFQDMCKHRYTLYHDGMRQTNFRRQQLQEQMEYFAKARSDVAAKKKQVRKEIIHLRDPNLLQMEMNRRMTSGGKGVFANGEASPTGSVASYDSDESSEAMAKTLELTKPVMHFLNALVRKVSLVDGIVQEGDKTLHDVKIRRDSAAAAADREEKERRKQKSDAVKTPEKALTPQERRRQSRLVNKNSVIINNSLIQAARANEQTLRASDLGSIGSSSQGLAESSTGSRVDKTGSQRSGTLPFGTGMTSKEFMNVAGITTNLVTSQSHTPAIQAKSPAPNIVAIQSFHIPRRKLSTDDTARIKESVRSYNKIRAEGDESNPLVGLFAGNTPINTPPVGAGHGADTGNAGRKEPMKLQVQRVVGYLLDQTESATTDDFIARFQQGQKLAEQLKSQQVKLDSRLTQLKKEHHDFTEQLSDMALMTNEMKIVGEAGDELDPAILGSRPASSAAAGQTRTEHEGSEEADGEFVGNADRYLDNKLFNAEVRLHQMVRNNDKAVMMMSEVRSAVTHLVDLLSINSKLLSALPRSAPPPLHGNEDISGSLAWFEERITQLSEALTMDANRPTGGNTADENKTISERQMELAFLVQDMHKNGHRRRLKLSHHQKGQMKKQAMSRGLITDESDVPFVSPHAGIKVLPQAKIDRAYDQKMKEIHQEREKREEVAALNSKIIEKSQHNNETQRFLSDGLNHKVSKDLSRQSNMLQQKPQGRHVSCGLVLSSVLAARGQTFTPPVTQVLKNKSDVGADAADGVGDGNGTSEQHLDRLASSGSAVQGGVGPGVSVIGNTSFAGNTASTANSGTSTYSSPSRMEIVD